MNVQTRPLTARGSTEISPLVSGIRRYGIAIGAVLVTVGIKLVVDGLGPDHPFLLLTAAVIIASWYGGRGPGILATALALASGVFFLVIGSIPVESDLVGLGALATQAVIVVWITVGMREARQHAQEAIVAVESARKELRFAVAVRDEVLRLWSRKVKGPLVGLESIARRVLDALQREGYRGEAIGPLQELVAEAGLLRRVTAGWTEGGPPPRPEDIADHHP